MVRTSAKLLLALCLLGAQAWAESQFTVKLPTPRDHYKTYDAGKAALELMGKVMNDLDPQTRELVMKFMQGGKGPEDLPDVDPKQALEMIRAMGLAKYKPELLDLFIHKSQVLELCPPEYQDNVLPIMHDALLAFMDGLSEERLAERLFTLSQLPPDTPRGEKILVLASKIPTLQKLGQIVARMEVIPPDVSKYLQTLESGISTITRDELVGFIKSDVGEDMVEKHRIMFAGEILAEASVGAVIRATYQSENMAEPDDIVCKLIKPYVVTGLPRELEIIDGLIDLADDNAGFYQLEGVPLKELFQELKEKLGEELLVTQEQENFKRAYEFYRNSKWVSVPRIFDFSTENVTFMEFFHGEKINEAFPGDQEKRTIVAKRLMQVMLYDSLFSKPEVAIFHGDPHAGNVMHVTDDQENPYRIGLLDWGLIGEFNRERRMEMVQLTLALQQKNRKKLHRNVGALLRNGLPRDPEKRQQVLALADKCLEAKGGTMQVYAGLVTELTTNGFVLDSNFALYIKSQATLDGIYRELDPELNSEKYLEKLTGRRVMKELPKRLLFLPAWNYRGYRSLLSNGDVFAQVFH